jgi:hypothetical protein
MGGRDIIGGLTNGFGAIASTLVGSDTGAGATTVGASTTSSFFSTTDSSIGLRIFPSTFCSIFDSVLTAFFTGIRSPYEIYCCELTNM